MRLSIVVPVYNEEDTVAAVIEKVRGLPLDKEIIVVNDGSTDGTREALRRYESGVPDVRVHNSPVNLGKGSSVRIGFGMAKGDIITIQDADLELDPNEYVNLIRPIVEGTADVVFGSRFLAGKRQGTWSSRLANRALTTLTNRLFGGHITDTETCYKVFSRAALSALRLRASRFEIEPELAAQVLKRGLRLVELPIAYTPRTNEQGKKISWRDGVQAVATLISQKLDKK